MYSFYLQLEMKEIELDDDNDEESTERYPCWACQLKAYSDTWSHARRKRRMEMRQQALKKQKTEDSSSNDVVEPEVDNTELKEPEKNSDPLLVCTLLAREKGKIDDDSDELESEEESETNDQKMLRICLVFESGHGGKQSLETLRQYFVNKLNIREFFHKQNPSKPNKKKRKKKK